MNHSDPVYVVDFRKSDSFGRIERAQPGDEVDILVRLELPADSPGVRAKGRRSDDGTSFEIAVLTDDGPEAHSWTWDFLCEALLIHRGTSGG